MIKIIILTVISVYILWLILNFVLLIYKNANTLNTFKKLEQLFIKRYEIWDKFTLSEECRKYLEELKSLPQGIKFLNRKLALNYVISEQIRQNISQEELPDECKIINAELSNIGEIYNDRADILKRAVEIFPKSFFARFLNIKSTDYYRG